MSGRGSSTSASTSTHARRLQPVTDHAMSSSTSRRTHLSSPYLPSATSNSNDDGQAQAAVDSQVANGSFRPLVLSHSPGMNDWSTRVGTGDRLITDNVSSSSRRPIRTRSGSRRNRRLFASLPSATERRREANASVTSSSGHTQRRRQNTSDESSRFDTVLDSSPHLELPDHSLHSFKRSFEDATLASSTSAIGLNEEPVSSQSDSSPSGSSAVFSSTPPSSSPSTSFTPDRAGAGFVSALQIHQHTHQQPPLLPLPESWLRFAQSDQNIGTSTSALRHSPPTPDNAGARIKRRRSRTDGANNSMWHGNELSEGSHDQPTPAERPSSDTLPSTSARSEEIIDEGENQTVGSVDTAPLDELFSDWFDNDDTNQTDFYGMSLDLMENTSRGGVADHAADMSNQNRQAGHEDEENRTNLDLSPSDTEEVTEETPLISALESPSASTTVSMRRGLQRQFSLGTLPLFHFEEEEDAEDEEVTPDTPGEGLAADAGHQRVRTRSSQGGAPAPSIRLRSRLPRRPDLQRNTTAVSPPEESPGNTPEETNEQRDAFSVYPGPRHWHSTADRPSPTARTASGEFVRARPSPFYSLRSHYGDQAPQLSLDLDIPGDTMYDAAPIAPSTSSRLNIPEPAGNGRTRSTSAATASSNSSSLGTGWHSDVERDRAELLSDHLETSRRIAADVQRLQARLDARGPLDVPSRSHTPYPLERYPNHDTPASGTSSAVPPRVSLSSALGSTSRRPDHSNQNSYQGSSSSNSTDLWGEVGTTSQQISDGNMATASASITLQPNFTRRPGALGRSNMRGPTRSSNEAWMRAQGIDFYDSLASVGSSTRSPLRPTGVTPASSSTATATRIPTSVTAPTLPSFRRTTPTPVSSLPPSPSLPSIQGFVASGVPPRPEASSRTESNWPAAASSSRGTLSEHIAQGTLPPPVSWGRNSSRTVSVGHPRPNPTSSSVTGMFRPLGTEYRPRHPSGPQLEAIRPISPLFQPNPLRLHPEQRQRQNTFVSDLGSSDDENDTIPAVHPLSTSLNGSRSPMSWLQEAPSTGTRQHSSRSRSNRSANSNTSITDWFRGHTNEMPPTRSTTADLAPSAHAAASETEEASDGIAAAVRRLDDVRRLLDEVEQNMQRRRQSYEARISEQSTESYRSSRRLLRDISATDTRSTIAARGSSDAGSTLLSTRLPSIRTSPVNSSSRPSGSDATRMPSMPAPNGFEIPPRARSQQRPEGNRPTLQPFEEIFAEVEAEFSQRDRTRSAGERLPGSRTYLHGLSRDRRREAEGGAAPYQPRDRQATPELSSSSLETIQSELTRLRRRLQRDWSPHRASGFALRDSINTHLPDVAGLRARQAAASTSDLDFDLFDFGGPSDTTVRHEAQSERVPLPPFLLRSLRARRQATFGHREGTSDIAGELGNYAGDFDLDMSYEGLLALSERLGEVKRRGATDEALSQGLSLFVYTKITSDATSVEDRETRCAICLEDYEEQDKCARSTKCGHALHQECLTTWLRRNDTCPICRQTAV